MNNTLLKEIMEQNEIIDIKNIYKHKIDLIENELKFINQLISKLEQKLNNQSKKIYLNIEDIIKCDKTHNYIFIKSNGRESPEIIVVNKDDIEDKNNL